MKNLEIKLGALCPKLSEQLEGKYHPKTLALYDRIADAITILLLNDILTIPQADRARKRLFRKLGLSVPSSKQKPRQ
jgi:hypothetical protein